MERKLRTCAVCLNHYKFCNKCREDADKPLWYFTFCSINCHDIYDITSKFEDGRIDAKKAKAQLDKLDLSKLDNFGESYKKSINKIINSASVHVEVETDKIADVTGTTDDTVIENNTDIVEEKELKKPRNKKAKNDVEE